MFTVVSKGFAKVEYCHPHFLNVYMNGLSDILCRTECGCTMGGRMINHPTYAYELAILSPSAKGLQQLVDICAAYVDISSVGLRDITFNHAKTVCMLLPSKVNYTLNSPLISLNLRKQLSFVPKFKYLGSFITQDNSDDENMRRKRGNCYARSNVII